MKITNFLILKKKTKKKKAQSLKISGVYSDKIKKKKIHNF